jgi:hypothetical protein
VATAAAFDFDNGNAPIDVIIPEYVVPAIYADIAPSDATILLRITTEITNAWFDAIAPYHPTAIGVYSNLGRRPTSESATNRNKNIAIFYASYRNLNSTLPQFKSSWDAMMASVGLDPTDTSTDLKSPIGIGNVAGAAVNAFREQDGMNQLGDANGRLYNRHPYWNSTGYEPVNTAYDLFDPSRWQPAIFTTENGIFRVQQFVTPQYGSTKPYSFSNPEKYHVRPPHDSNPAHWTAYKAQVDQVLAVSANLKDYQKMMAELVNDKIRGVGFGSLFVALSHGMTLDQFVQYDFTTNMAAFDGGIVVWQEKKRYDATRPASAIAFVYGDQPVTAWGGPGQGTVTNLPASQWKGYIPLPDHPEYPSGTQCICEGFAEASRRFTGSDNFGWSVPSPKGSSLVEPGVTPASDITLGPWATFTQFSQECGQARNWGGVHFLPAIQASYDLCGQFGDSAYEFVQAHINGNVGGN